MTYLINGSFVHWISHQVQMGFIIVLKKMSLTSRSHAQPGASSTAFDTGIQSSFFHCHQHNTRTIFQIIIDRMRSCRLFVLFKEVPFVVEKWKMTPKVEVPGNLEFGNGWFLLEWGGAIPKESGKAGWNPGNWVSCNKKRCKGASWAHEGLNQPGWLVGILPTNYFPCEMWFALFFFP